MKHEGTHHVDKSLPLWLILVRCIHPTLTYHFFHIHFNIILHHFSSLPHGYMSCPCIFLHLITRIRLVNTNYKCPHYICPQMQSESERGREGAEWVCTCSDLSKTKEQKILDWGVWVTSISWTYFAFLLIYLHNKSPVLISLYLY
jgi:hypothetical protein